MKSSLYIALLCAPIVGALAVPFYNRVAPTLCGWPFFYWWQTGCVLAGALLTGAAHLLHSRGEAECGDDESTSSQECVQ